MGCFWLVKKYLQNQNGLFYLITKILQIKHAEKCAGGATDKTPGLINVLDRVKSLWAWVRILKSGFDKFFFSFHCFSTYVFIVYL